jgi:hypothetical protein
MISPSSSRSCGLSPVVGRPARSKWNRVFCRRSSSPPGAGLELARAEARALTDQLRQARADLHRLGIAEQNRALVYAAATGAAGVLVGVAIGLGVRRK